MGNPRARAFASFLTSKQAAHRKRRVPNFFTNAIDPYAAISRDKSPMLHASGNPIRLLSSPKRSREKSNSNLPNKTPSRLAVLTEQAQEAGA
jgi:hypothetical protein